MPRSNRQTKSGQRPKERDRRPRGRRGRDDRLSVRGELRKEPDVQKIARVVIALAMAQAEADAERQAAGHVATAPEMDTEIADE